MERQEDGPQETVLRRAKRAVRGPLLAVGALSLVINMLMMTGPLFMLLVYDKVLTSQSAATLAALSLIAVVLYVFYGLLEGTRSKILARVGVRFDYMLAPSLFEATLRLPLYLGQNTKIHEPLQDLTTMRTFLMGPAPAAFFDLPWLPVYMLVLYLVHPVLGLAAAIGAGTLIVFAALNQVLARVQAGRAGQAQAGSQATLVDAQRGAEAAAAMGMGGALQARWAQGYSASVNAHRSLSDHAGIFGALTKTTRLLLQSAMIAVGAFLVIEGQMSPGSMIACSIIVARALAPVEQIIAQWRSVIAAHHAHKRLSKLVDALPTSQRRGAALAQPHQKLEVRGLTIVPPGASQPSVRDISFELEAGDALGIIGPSGSGKSTLARALTGAWEVARGEVRLDGAGLGQFPADTLGRSIGYLPQNVELFDGTIAENIARFRPDATDEQVIEAAKLAGVHELILSFADGYATPIGPSGATLSRGERQRIGLARALFGNPFLIVLDEPNANLDPLGEEHLTRSIQRIRQRGQIVCVVAHRPSAIFAANKILAERDGRGAIIVPQISDAAPSVREQLTRSVAMQQTLLTAKLSAQRSQLAQIEARRAQVQAQIDGFAQLIHARRAELEQVSEELAVQEALEKKRLIKRSLLRQTRNQHTRLNAELDDLASRIRAGEAQLTGLASQAEGLVEDARSETMGQMASVDARISAAAEKLRAAQDRMTRLEIRAPMAGMIHEMKLHTIGGVVRPGETVMSIIPKGEPLIVQGKIALTDIDQVSLGQQVRVSLKGIKGANAPELNGTLSQISADASTDPVSGRQYFGIKVAIDAADQGQIAQMGLQPGAPVELFLIGSARSAMSYITRPISDAMNGAMREE
ncbi:MAG: type I secretion system permease/ATPase [Neomegalonema sp.]|nr:type I secretion system permease/ATPase [Neomegalonema sp.]